MKYTSANPPMACMLTTNPCYRNTYRMKPLGVLWHTTGANNPNLKRCVQPTANDPNRAQLLVKLGVNKNGNDWGHTTRQVGVNAFIGKLASGAVSTAQTMPWDYAPWGCGGGSRGSCNDGWIQFEICEDDMSDPAYFEAVYKEAVELTAYLCKMYGLNPLGTVKFRNVTVPVILCHQDSYKLGLGSNHGDVYIWFQRYGKTMDNVRRDVAALLANNEPLYWVRKTWEDAESQIGAYKDLNNAKEQADKHPGYAVYDQSGRELYRSEEDDEMLSYEQFKQYMEKYEAERRALPGSGWSEADRQWAIETGLVKGGTGSEGMMWQDVLTREQAAAMFHREAERTGTA